MYQLLFEGIQQGYLYLTAKQLLCQWWVGSLGVLESIVCFIFSAHRTLPQKLSRHRWAWRWSGQAIRKSGPTQNTVSPCPVSTDKIPTWIMDVNFKGRTNERILKRHVWQIWALQADCFRVVEWDNYEMETLMPNELSLNSSNNPFDQILCSLDSGKTMKVNYIWPRF